MVLSKCTLGAERPKAQAAQLDVFPPRDLVRDEKARVVTAVFVFFSRVSKKDQDFINTT